MDRLTLLVVMAISFRGTMLVQGSSVPAAYVPSMAQPSGSKLFEGIKNV